MAQLEPQLWYRPFDASAYQGMVAAQEEVRWPLPSQSRVHLGVGFEQGVGACDRVLALA